MSKMIKYDLACKVNRGTEQEPVEEEIFLKKALVYNEANEQIAKREAYNGEYTIEDVEDEAALF